MYTVPQYGQQVTPSINPFQSLLGNPMHFPHQLDRVKGIESVKMFPTEPNSMYALFEENDDVMYIKSTDASNFPTIRRFRLVEEKEDDPKEKIYVTIEEFNKFKEELLNGKQYIRTTADDQPGPGTNSGTNADAQKFGQS